jgi:hypothetical protein
MNLTLPSRLGGIVDGPCLQLMSPRRRLLSFPLNPKYLTLGFLIPPDLHLMVLLLDLYPPLGLQLGALTGIRLYPNLFSHMTPRLFLPPDGRFLGLALMGHLFRQPLGLPRTDLP